MGKGARARQQRQQRRGGRRTGPYGRELVMVAMLEVGHIAGMVSLRAAGLDETDPVRIVLPVEIAGNLGTPLREATLDAEEQYWSLIGPLVRSAGSTDPDAVARHVHAWLAERDWFSVAARVSDPTPVFVLTHAGHIGLWVSPPFADRPALVVFDPMQLRRQEISLRAAIDIARRTDTPGSHANHLMRLLEAVSELTAAPWTVPATYREPTPAEAKAEMVARRNQFLARTPYQRPPEHDLPEVPPVARTPVVRSLGGV